MADYITTSQIEIFWGATQLSQLCTPQSAAQLPAALITLTISGGDRSAYTAQQRADADTAIARLEAIITEQSQFIDNYLGQRYALPLDAETVAGNPLEGICSDLVRYVLASYSRPSEDMEKRYNRAIAWLESIADGKTSLNQPSGGESEPASPVSVFVGNNDPRGYLSY